MVMTVRGQPTGIVVLPIGRKGDPGDPGVMLSASRPGAYPSLFTPDLAGAPETAAPLDPSGASNGIYRLTGAGIIATRAVAWLEPNAFFAIRVGFMRVVDPNDSNNDAIRVGIQWLDSNYGALAQSTVKTVAGATTRLGLQIVTSRVPSQRNELPSVIAPQGAVFWRPFVETFGLDGTTAIWSLVVQDVTNTGVYAPDVSALEGRISAIESLLDAGLPLTAPILPSYTVATLPASGNRGRKAFASDGRAPDAAGNLEPANAGTGVEVTDNGAAWKITGTNQTVQA